MAESQPVAERRDGAGLLVLGVDTCGATGSVALARIEGGAARVLGQTELAGRTYSATLVAAVGELLTEQKVKLGELAAMVVVHGPGSFTGVRVGLSAVKGMAEPGRIPVVAVSRLAVLAAKAGVEAAALDAHRHEVFLRVMSGEGVRELLAGAEEISQVSEELIEGRSPVPKGEGPGAPTGMVSQVSEARPFDKLRAGSGAPSVVAICEDAAEGLLRAAWPAVGLVRVEAPTAADAIGVCVPAILAGEFADVALLDGHYLRRSDAEIFGDAVQKR